MVLTEEEKKEYLINYKPQSKWYNKLVLYLGVVFWTLLFFFVLSYFGYISLDLSDYLILLCASVLGIVLSHIARYVMHKVKK